MSSRFDKLEVEIVEALRRAPGAEPSADLDARILARAHAAVRPVRRTQPRWMSVAAGLVVLVGSGLALRIWQQVEHAPSALDAPPAAIRPAAPAAEGAAAPDAGQLDQAAPTSEADRMASMEAAGAALERQEAANAVPVNADTRRPALLTEPEKSRLQSAPATADAGAPGADPARPFPAQAPLPAAAPAPPPPAEPAPQLAAEPVVLAPPAAPPAPAPAATAAAPAVTGVMAKREALAQPMAEEALAGADDMVGAARSAAGSLARDAAESKLADQAIDPWTAAIDALRAARDTGDDAAARRVLDGLRRDFPSRALPEDLAAYADSLR